MTTSILTLLEQASKHHEEGQLTQAKEIYETILAQAPEQPDALHQLGLLFAGLNEMNVAIVFLEKAVAILPQSLIFRNNLANALVAMQLYDQALSHYQAALSINPQYAQAYNNIGTVYYKKKEFDQAANYFNIALSYLPNYADAHYNLGLCYVQQNEDEKAVAEFIAVVTMLPNHLQAHQHLANCFFKLRQLDPAAREYLFVLQAQEDNVDVLYNLANVYFLQNKMQLATQYFKQVLHLDSKSVDAIFNLGVIYYLHYDYASASNYFERVLNLDSQYLKAYYNLGIINAKQNNYIKAAEYYQRYLDIAPNDEAIRYLLAASRGDTTIPVAPVAYVTSLFDFYADHFDADLTQQLAYQVPQLLLALVRPYLLAEKPSATLLDLGCGTGLAGQVFLPYAQKLIGVDLSRNMLIQAQAKEIYDQLILGDCRDALTKFTEEIDILVAADTFVYFGDLLELIKRCALALPCDGLLVFSTERHDNATQYQLLPSGRFAHTRDYIERVCAQTQLTVVAVKEGTLRTQAGLPVPGYLWLVRK